MTKLNESNSIIIIVQRSNNDTRVNEVHDNRCAKDLTITLTSSHHLSIV